VAPRFGKNPASKQTISIAYKRMNRVHCSSRVKMGGSHSKLVTRFTSILDAHMLVAFDPSKLRQALATSPINSLEELNGPRRCASRNNFSDSDALLVIYGLMNG
jgi:hypothetical protein